MRGRRSSPRPLAGCLGEATIKQKRKMGGVIFSCAFSCKTLGCSWPSLSLEQDDWSQDATSMQLFNCYKSETVDRMIDAVEGIIPGASRALPTAWLWEPWRSSLHSRGFQFASQTGRISTTNSNLRPREPKPTCVFLLSWLQIWRALQRLLHGLSQEARKVDRSTTG